MTVAHENKPIFVCGPLNLLAQKNNSSLLSYSKIFKFLLSLHRPLLSSLIPTYPLLLSLSSPSHLLLLLLGAVPLLLLRRSGGLAMAVGGSEWRSLPSPPRAACGSSAGGGVAVVGAAWLGDQERATTASSREVTGSSARGWTWEAAAADGATANETMRTGRKRPHPDLAAVAAGCPDLGLEFPFFEFLILFSRAGGISTRTQK